MSCLHCVMFSNIYEISLYQALMLCKSVSNQGKGRRAKGHSQKNPLHSAQCGRLGFCSKFDCS